MHNQVKIAVLALSFYSPLLLAQNTKTDQNAATSMDENAFTFTEAQLGEDDDMSQNVTLLTSNNNEYASEAGYLFSPVRFRYLAGSQKYNDIYVNGAPMNDMESGQFRYSNIGGLNRFTRSSDFALPFESNNFSMPGMAGSNNYDFRAGSQGAGNYASIGMANRNYTLRGMYTYSSGFNSKGLALTAGLTYRWANHGYVEGTFYNALSYFLGIEKKWNSGSSLSFTTWGNPTERSTQGASTDEAYWLSNDYYYNPYWGYQNGHKRNSRVVNDYSPSGILTWDWNINRDLKLTTSVFGRYGIYKSTKLDYSNSENPQPDYWKNLPSSFYDVWDNQADITQSNDETSYKEWLNSYQYWKASKANRQINWDQLYFANQQAAAIGNDAIYYVQAKHNNALTLSVNPTLTAKLHQGGTIHTGLTLAENSGRHYLTMDDLLGANEFHNINTYAIGTYPATDPRVQYDLRTEGADGKGKVIKEGDKFGYDYNILVQKGLLWGNYGNNIGRFHVMLAAKIGQTQMRRKGFMQNGMFPENSYGKSGRATFGEGGAKGSLTLDAGRGHVFKVGAGYEWCPPTANTAFISPEMNNDFVLNLHDEHVFSSEFDYQYQNAWLHANVNAYFSYLDHVTEWQNFYFDDANAFTYVSMTGMKKKYYGVEAGMDFKLTSFLDVKTLGTWSDARNVNNASVNYMNSNSATVTHDIVMNKNMRESGTPLTAASAGINFHSKGWYVDLSANYYDRIYLSYSPCFRYQKTLTTMGSVDNQGNLIVPSQAKGHGGWMVDGSIGKSVYLKHGQLNFNLMVTNILNNQHIVSGGYEQSRSDYTVDQSTGTLSKQRVYKFSKNPKKYYVYGANGIFQISYRF